MDCPVARDDRRQGAEDRPTAPDLHRRSGPGLRSHRWPFLEVATWTITIRARSRVERLRFDALEPALAALEARADELADASRRRPAETALRRYSPEQQVVARLELSGPERRLAKVHAGVDIRGDGSSEAYLGRVRRQLLAQAAGEEPVAVIRRALAP